MRLSVRVCHIRKQSDRAVMGVSVIVGKAAENPLGKFVARTKIGDDVVNICGGQMYDVI